MARMHLGNRDVPESGNSSNSSARNLGLDAVHNAETGLSTPPEDENKAIVEQVIPTIIVMPSYTSTPTSTNTSTRMNRSTHATAPLGPSVPMRRGVVVGGRKQMRRKRGAMIPSATTMAAATAAAQQAIAAATTTTKAAEKVPSPPPSPKQQPIHVTQPSQAPPPPPQPQTEPIQAEAPEETNTVATQSLVPREYNLIDEALVPYGHLPPRTAAQKQVVRRLLIRPANDQESHHIETERVSDESAAVCTALAATAPHDGSHDSFSAADFFFSVRSSSAYFMHAAGVGWRNVLPLCE
jgi:hypothetical protein